MKRAILSGFLILSLYSGFSQNIDMDLVEARDEFRWGVTAYHGGFFEKAVLSLERSFALKPGDIRTQFWLGEAYRRLGFEETALKIWNSIEDAGKADPLLISRMDALNFKRGLGRELSRDGIYVPAYTIRGRFTDYNIFQRPAAVAVLDDGSYFLTSFTTNEVLYLDANGAVLERIQGGIHGLDHPFGITAHKDRLYVSEFNGDRITKMDFVGGNISRFGSSGSGEGELSGPQFLSVDTEGYLYVTEIGNRRVSKFSPQGEFLFSFGQRNPYFQGLKNPSGILAYEGNVFVSDSRAACLYVFDSNGNYLYSLGNEILEAPEGISLHSDGKVVIADTRRIMELDTDSRKFTQLAEVDEKNSRIVDVAVDGNRNLLAVDFNRSTIEFFTEMKEFYSGLAVEIMSVNSSDYPRVQVHIDVSSTMGEPFTGLKAGNFILTDAGAGVEEPELIFTGQNARTAGYSLVVEKSPDFLEHTAEYSEALDLIQGAFGNDIPDSVVHAGAEAVLYPGTGPRLIDGAEEGEITEGWNVDESIFLAGSQLINRPEKRAVILVTSGILPPDAFNDYSLIQLSNYFVNNRLSFYVVYTHPMEVYPRELEYLVDETGGESRYLYQPEGLVGMADRLLHKRDGLYVLEYTSTADTDFGRKYLELEAEVTLFSRSGRDEKGYFAPAF